MSEIKIPAGYKQTEVGIIPEDWDVESLGAIAQIERGKFTARPRNDPKYYGGHIPFIQTGDVANSNGLITCFSQTLNEKGLKVSKVFPAGTLFFTIAANIGDIGFSDFDTACPDSLVAIMPNQKINKFWLAQELKTRKRSFESLATHNAQMNINLEKLKPYLLPIPRIEEQTAIATVLSDVDALIASLNAQIAKKRDIKTATMQQLLTGKQRLAGFGEGKGMKPSELGEIPEDWEVVPLSHLLDGKPQYGINAPAVKLSINTPVYIRITDIDEDGSFKPTEKVGVNHVLSELYQLRTGDIVVARTGASVGKSYLYKETDGTLVYAGFLIKLQTDPNKLNPQFLFQFMKTEKYWNWVKVMSMRSGQPGINGNEYGQLSIPLTTLEEQTAIAGGVSAMDEEIAALEQRLAKTKAMKQGMMQELLTGRTRLV